MLQDGENTPTHFGGHEVGGRFHRPVALEGSLQEGTLQEGTLVKFLAWPGPWTGGKHGKTHIIQKTYVFGHVPADRKAIKNLYT